MLPTAGVMDDTNCMFAGDFGYYWISNPSEEDNAFAYHLFFNNKTRWISKLNHYLGVQIRPVINK